MCKFKRATTMALACAMLLSLLPMAVPKASAATTSTLANVTETYVDASDGSEVSKAETYSVTHKERSPQKIADFTYQDYSESVERVYSHKDISYIYGYPDKTVRPDRPMSRITMKGEITSPVNPEKGCRFAKRCPYATEACTQQDMVLTEQEPGHFVTCLRLQRGEI